jgi:hypothetical protein
MIRPRYLPPDACFDDPVAKLDPEVNARDSHFALASYGLARIKEWAARGNAQQRALRGDLVTLCICPEFLPCKRPSAAWVGEQHGVSREYASRLRREFARSFGAYIQFRGQRFLGQAGRFKRDGAGGGG